MRRHAGLSPRTLVFGLLLLVVALAATQAFSPAETSADVGSGSCELGSTPCDGNTGDIGENSCNADRACLNNTGRIGDNACNEVDACNANTARIGDDSCNAISACQNNAGRIGRDACNFGMACVDQTGRIGDRSCEGPNNCDGNTGQVGRDSCNDAAIGFFSCFENAGTVGNNSCNNGVACYRAGLNGFSTIGDRSCNEYQACDSNGACYLVLDSCDPDVFDGHGEIGNDSCNVQTACYNNGYGGTGIIGDRSCSGLEVCTFQGYKGGHGEIGDDSCFGQYACHLNGYAGGGEGMGTIGSRSCIGDYACYANDVPSGATIGDDSCVGGDVCYSILGSIGRFSCHSDAALCMSNSLAIGDCENNDPDKIPAICTAGERLEVRKLSLSPTSGHQFELLIDDVVETTVGGAGGSTGEVDVTLGAHTVGENVLPQGAAANYVVRIICRDQDGNGGVVAAGAGPALTVEVGLGEDIVCTIVNVRARGSRRWS